MNNNISKSIERLTLFIVTFLLLFVNTIIKTKSYECFEEKIICNVTIEDRFTTDSVIVVMKKEASEINKVYCKEYFGNIPIENIYDITYVSNEIKSDTSLNLSEFRQILDLKLKTSTKQDVIDVIKKIEKIDDVLCVSPNYLIEAEKQPLSASIPQSGIHRYPELWGLHSSVGINAEEAWDFTTGNSQVRVGVIDTGMYNHVDFAGNISNEGGDFVNMLDAVENIPGSLRDDPTGHGTHVSGIIGATGTNANGVTGVAWNVKIIPLQVSYWDSDEYDWLLSLNAITRAIIWCANNNVDIINFSAGTTNYYSYMQSAIDNFNGLFVAAAGNGGNDGIGDNNDIIFHYPSDYSYGQNFSSRVISVGAYKKNNNGANISVDLCTFSNYGQNSVSLFAPGESVLSCFPNNICNDYDYVFNDGTRACEMSSYFLTLINGFVESHSWEYLDENFSEIVHISGVDEATPGMLVASIHNGVGYHYMDGTSMATPYVTGTAALLWNILSNLPANYTKSQIASIVKTSILNSAITNDVGTPFNDKCVADGRLDAFGAIKHVLANYVVTNPITLNNSIATITKGQTVLSNNDYFINDNGFYELNVTYTRNYDFQISAQYPISVILYNSNFVPINYTELDISNNNVHFIKNLSIGTYYLRVSFSNSIQSGTILTLLSKHDHLYGSPYTWLNYNQHKATCICGNLHNEMHVVSAKSLGDGLQYVTCILCGGPANAGIVPGFKGIKITENGSFISSNGTLVLADEDIDLYLIGEMIFAHQDIEVQKNANLPLYLFRKDEDYLEK